MEIPDNQKRKITIKVDCDVYAYHNGMEVGKFEILPGAEMDKGPSGPRRLQHMNIDAEYQQAGIGTAMLKAAFEEFDKIQPPSLALTNKDNPVIDGGRALVVKGIEQGWLLDPDSD